MSRNSSTRSVQKVRLISNKIDPVALIVPLIVLWNRIWCSAQQETEARVISNFVEHMSELMLSVHDYERRLTLVSDSVYYVDSE